MIKKEPGVYLLLSSEYDYFKIGKTINLGQRVSTLKKDWSLDLKNSFFVERNNPIKLEKGLQNILDDFRVKGLLDSKLDGSTEWFKVECIDQCKSLINVMGYSIMKGISEPVKPVKNNKPKQSRAPKKVKLTNFEHNKRAAKWIIQFFHENKPIRYDASNCNSDYLICTFEQSVTESIKCFLRENGGKNVIFGGGGLTVVSKFSIRKKGNLPELFIPKEVFNENRSMNSNEDFRVWRNVISRYLKRFENIEQTR